MPIELAFSKVNTPLKMDCLEDAIDMKTALLEAFTIIIPEESQGWIAQSELYY